MNKHLFGTMALCATLMGATGAQAQTSLSDNRVLRDSSGGVVHALGSGSCVRTNWEAGDDVCAPRAMAEVKAPMKQTRTMLSTDEKTVYFEFDKASLTPDAQMRLDEVARRLTAAKDVKSASIVGYADRIGTSDYNQRLSERRAQTVKDYLAQRGYLNTELAQVRAVGESQPSADCAAGMPRAKQISCLAPDRKVEVELKYVDTKVSRR